MQRPPSGGFCILGAGDRLCLRKALNAREGTARSAVNPGSSLRVVYARTGGGKGLNAKGAKRVSGCAEIIGWMEAGGVMECVKLKGMWARSSVGRAMPF